MTIEQVIEKYGFNERGNKVIAVSNLTAAEKNQLKDLGWDEDHDKDYMILVGGAN